MHWLMMGNVQNTLVCGLLADVHDWRASAVQPARPGKLIWIASRHSSAGLLLHEHKLCTQKAPCCMWQEFRQVLHSHLDMSGARIQSLQLEFVDLHYRCSGLQLLSDQLDCTKAAALAPQQFAPQHFQHMTAVVLTSLVSVTRGLLYLTWIWHE